MAKNIILTPKSQNLNISTALKGNFWDDEISPNYINKYEVYESSEDLLALSVCWKRLRDTKVSIGASTVIDSKVFEKLLPEDREKANDIRDYYSKKIMMLKLKSNNQLTSFRRDMNDFIHSDGKQFQETTIPLAYRLPEFYEYDTAFDNLSEGYNREINGHDIFLQSTVKKLKFIKKLIVRRRKTVIVEYWFSDESNNLAQLVYTKDNSLLSLLDMHLSVAPMCNVEGKFYKRERDGKHYLQVDKYQFV